MSHNSKLMSIFGAHLLLPTLLINPAISLFCFTIDGSFTPLHRITIYPRTVQLTSKTKNDGAAGNAQTAH